MDYQWNFTVILENWRSLLNGLLLTVFVSIVSMIIAAVWGLALAMVRTRKIIVLRTLATMFVEFFRTTPALVQVVWIYYALPLVSGITLSALMAGIVGLSLNLSAFVSEVYRAGIESVPRSLVDAGAALGQTKFQTFKRIVVPIAVRRMVPPFGALWVSVFKDASILSLIGAAELMYQARLLAAETYRPLEIFTAVGIIYFILTYPQAVIVEKLYKKYRPKE